MRIVRYRAMNKRIPEEARLSEEQGAHINWNRALLRLVAGDTRQRDWVDWLATQRDRQGRPMPPRRFVEMAREHCGLPLFA